MATAADDGAPGLEPELILVAHPDAQLRLHAGPRARRGRRHRAAERRAGRDRRQAPGAVRRQRDARARQTAGGAIGGARPLGLLPRPARAGRRSRGGGRAARAGGVGRGRLRQARAGGGRPLREVARPSVLADGGELPTSRRARATWTRRPAASTHVRRGPTAGGDGAGMEVMIVGGAWRLEHEDLHGDAAGVIAGTQIDALSFRNHGTAMLGVVRADRNSFGVTGVAPACRARQVATFGLGTAAAINAAADALPVGGDPAGRVAAARARVDRRRLGGLHRARVVAGRLRRDHRPPRRRA